MGDFDKESLRKGLVQTMHNGTWLVLDADVIDVDWAALSEDATCFPPEVWAGPGSLFVEEIFQKLPRASDELAARVDYANLDAEAIGAFQDRTKAVAPEECVGVDSSFQPKVILALTG